MSEGQKPYSLTLLFGICVTLVLLGPLFWLHMEMPENKPPLRAVENGDMWDRVVPGATYLYENVQQGVLPLWNPYQFCGTPFLSDPRHGFFQPLSWVFPLMPPNQALALHAFIAIMLMGLFFLLYARAQKLSHTSAVFGAFTYTFSGAAAAAMSHPNWAAIFVWTPLVAWALYEHAQRLRYTTACFAALTLSFLWLSGLPLAALLLTVLLSVHLLLPPRKVFESDPAPSVARRLGTAVLITVLVVLLTAVQWLPALFWLWQSDAPMAGLTGGVLPGLWPESVHLLLPHLLIPRPDTLPHVTYIGLAPLLLLVAAPFYRAKPGMARLALASGLILMGVALAMRPLAVHLDVSTFILPTAMLMLALSAAFGFETLFYPPRDRRNVRLWIPRILILLMGLLLLFIGAVETRGTLIPVMVILVIAILVRWRWVNVIGGLLLCALLFLDLYQGAENRLEHPYENKQAFRRELQEVFQPIQENVITGRALLLKDDDTVLVGNPGMLEYRMMAMGDGQPLTHAQDHWWSSVIREASEADDAPPSRNLLDYMAVQLVGVTPLRYKGLLKKTLEREPYQQLSGQGKILWFKNSSALPRVYWVPGWETATDMEAILTRLTDPEFDPYALCIVTPSAQARTALSSELPDGPVPLAPDAAQKRYCHIAASSPEQVNLEVDVPQQGIVVLTDSYSPHWRVLVDGVAQPLLQVNGLFRGVVVPAGAHSISFYYIPWPLWLGAMVSLLTLAGLVVYALASLFRKH